MADTWREAVLRPLAMAAPNGWVYTEIMAPDFRFAFALILFLVALIWSVRRKWTGGNAQLKSVFVLMGLVFFSFVPWMATSGNGRYFMPYLVLIGPLCIGLINMLPFTRPMKATVTILVLCLQGVALHQNNPWEPFDSWASVPWLDAPYFSVDIDPKVIEPDTTYITVASQTLSLVAPQFPTTSRWVNLSVFNGTDFSTSSGVYDQVRQILETSKSLKIFQRSSPRSMVRGTDQPNQRAIADINSYLQPHRLAMAEPADCKLLPSKSLVFTTLLAIDDTDDEKSRIKEKAGFWICSLVFPVPPPLVSKLTEDQTKAIKVFSKIESLCPRFFAPGQTLVGTHQAGYTRAYSSSDSSLILTFNGHVYVQNARALNPELMGLATEVLKEEYKLDCTKFRGRSGLPWEREI